MNQKEEIRNEILNGAYINANKTIYGYCNDMDSVNLYLNLLRQLNTGKERNATWADPVVQG